MKIEEAEALAATLRDAHEGHIPQRSADDLVRCAGYTQEDADVVLCLAVGTIDRETAAGRLAAAARMALSRTR